MPARVLNLVVIVDGEFRGEIENRLERVGRYHPSRLVLCAVEPGRTTIDAWASVGRRGRPSRATSRSGASGSSSTSAERHLQGARHDRRPAAGPRPRDRGVGAARPRRGASTRCAGWRRSCWSTPRTSPTSPAALDARRRAVRRAPTSSTSRGCARRRGASASPPPSTRRRCARALGEISAVTVRHRARLAGRRRCCSAAGCARAWAGGRTSLGERRRRALARRTRAAARQEVTLRLERGRAAGRARARRRDDRDGLGRVGLARPRPGRAARRCAARATARSRRGRCWAPRAARRASSARASARRCCATRPTCRRSRCARERWRGCTPDARRSASLDDPAAAVADLLAEAAARGRPHRAHRRLDARSAPTSCAAAARRRLERRDGVVRRRALRAARPPGLELRDGATRRC